MSYRVKTVSQMTGIPRNTLVAWERRYGVPGPGRTDGGYRIYSDADVAYLRELRGLVEGGLAISEAIAQVGRRPGASHGEAANSAPQEAPSELVDALLDRLVAFDAEGAAPILRRADQLPFEEAIEMVWRPLLVRVGEDWESGEISVAQEHYATGVIRQRALAMFRALERPNPAGPKVVCACVPDELHDLPLLFLAITLRRLDWQVLWLGAAVPTGDLCAVAATQRPDLVCLSVVARDPEQALEVARQVVANAPRTSVVAVGGAGARALTGKGGPRLWIVEDGADLVRRWESRPKLVSG